ncbi:hypothetical protein BVY00_02090 [bacterium G20]|nr:hypothetical protein BVY00_02090 [bacterium G20]
MKSLQLSIYNYPQHQILKLRNLVADYSAQDLVLGRQFSMNDQLSFINEATWKMVKGKLMVNGRARGAL